MVKHLPTAFFVALTALSICPDAQAGPADAYADQCRYMYEEERYRYLDAIDGFCLTTKGRVLPFTFRFQPNISLKEKYAHETSVRNGDGGLPYKEVPDITANMSNTSFSSQIGSLDKDFTSYSDGRTIYTQGRRDGQTMYLPGSYTTRKFVQIDKANKLLVYSCSSNSSGTCNGTAAKKVYDYLGRFEKLAVKLTQLKGNTSFQYKILQIQP